MKVTLPARPDQPHILTVLVTGGWNFTDEHRIDHFLDEIYALVNEELLGMVIVQSGGRGADKLARIWAWQNNVLYITERPDWQRDGLIAVFLANQRMIDLYKPDVCVAMPGNWGTADVIKRCLKAGVPILRGE
jgi:hypothetical protein